MSAANWRDVEKSVIVPADHASETRRLWLPACHSPF